MEPVHRAHTAMLRTRPLFTLDPGWLFLAAGLAMFVAVTLIPAHRDAHQLREQLTQLRAEEQYAYDRLRAYSTFLDEMDAPDAAMIRRLEIPYGRFAAAACGSRRGSTYTYYNVGWVSP